MTKGYGKLRRRLLANPITGITPIPADEDGKSTKVEGHSTPSAVVDESQKVQITVTGSTAQFIADSEAAREGLAEGLALKEEGQYKALAAEPSWSERANNYVYSFIEGERITSDELIEAIGLPNPDATGSNHNNAVGALFTSMARRNLIKRTGDYVQSSRKANRGAVIAVWERTAEQ